MSVRQLPKDHDYRPDIDGLRAFAVLSVLCFHANFLFFGGGFIGVDVFFVISGYLISGIIFNSLDRGHFTFRDFYTRRVNRIFPALIVVLVTTAILGWMFLFGGEFETLGKHIVAGAVYGSNFVLWKESGYFDSPLKPLLHLWSLSVEEQFYLFFPLVAVVAWKRKWNMRSILIGMIVISFALNVFAIRAAHGTAAFYMPFTRIWEILVGCLLLNLKREGSLTRLVGAGRAARLREALPLIGIAALFVCLVLIDDTMAWPGFWSLLPVAASAAVIAGGRDSAVNRTFLGHPWMVAIGLISYPLYLWHWPLLVFTKLVYEHEPPILVRVAVLAISFILAFATYRFIESPIRFGKRKGRSAVRLLPLLGGVGGLGAILATGFVPPMIDWKKGKSVAEIGADWEAPSGGSVHKAGKQFFIYRVPGNISREVVLLGDSHAQQYWPRALELAASRKTEGPAVTLIAYAGCPLIPGVNRPGTSWEGGAWICPQFYAAAMKYASSDRVESVILANFWEEYFAKALVVRGHTADPENREKDTQVDEAFAQMTRDIGQLTARGKRVYIVLSNPTLVSHDLSTGLPRRLSAFSERKIVPVVSRKEFNARVSAISARLKAVAATTGSTVIDPADFLCQPASCPTEGQGGIPIYRDYDHLRAGFVRRDVKFLDSAFK